MATAYGAPAQAMASRYADIATGPPSRAAKHTTRPSRVRRARQASPSRPAARSAAVTQTKAKQSCRAAAASGAAKSAPAAESGRRASASPSTTAAAPQRAPLASARAIPLLCRSFTPRATPFDVCSFGSGPVSRVRPAPHLPTGRAAASRARRGAPRTLSAPFPVEPDHDTLRHRAAPGRTHHDRYDVRNRPSAPDAQPARSSVSAATPTMMQPTPPSCRRVSRSRKSRNAATPATAANCDESTAVIATSWRAPAT